MVSFASPDALWLLVLPAAAVAFAVRRHSRRLHQQRRLASPSVWHRVMGGAPATGLLRMLAWAAAGAMIALGLARPQWGELPAEESIRTRDLVVALDVSDSMLCPDVRPTRLARGLEVIRQLLPAVTGNRIGVVVFAGEAYALVPLTTDLSAVAVFLDGVQPGMVGRPGSNLEAAGAAALKLMLGDGEGRVVILMTDGENLQGDVEGAANALREAGVGVLAVVAGTENGGPIPVPSANGGVQYKRDAGGQPVVTRARPEVLREIADQAGGMVIDLADRDVVPKLTAAIEELRTREVEATRTVRRVERFQVFLAVAAALLVGGFALGPWRRLAAAVLLALSCISLPAAAQQGAAPSGSGSGPVEAAAAEPEPPKVPWWQRLIPGGGRRLARSGAANFESGDLEGAVRDFAAAAALDPDQPDRLYDLGTALAAAGQAQSADPLLERAHGAGVEGAAYNGGTGYLTQGQAQRAAQMLREALLAAPDDPEVKRNYELALKQLQEQQQQQQEQEQDQQQQQEQQDQQATPTPTPGSEPPGIPPTPTPDSQEPLYSALDRAEAEARDAMRSPTPASSKVEKDW